MRYRRRGKRNILLRYVKKRKTDLSPAMIVADKVNTKTKAKEKQKKIKNLLMNKKIFITFATAFVNHYLAMREQSH